MLSDKNKIIAEFHNEAFYSQDFQAWLLLGKLYPIDKLEYHKNFVHIMSVLKQIINLGYDVDLCKFSCHIYSKHIKLKSIDVFKKSSDLIETIFEDCYEFITIFNLKCESCLSHNIHLFTEIQTYYCKSCGYSKSLNND